MIYNKLNLKRGIGFILALIMCFSCINIAYAEELHPDDPIAIYKTDEDGTNIIGAELELTGIQKNGDGYDENLPVQFYSNQPYFAYAANTLEEPNYVQIEFISQPCVTVQKDPYYVNAIFIDQNPLTSVRWRTGSMPLLIYGLPDGKYTLNEYMAPWGYNISERVIFYIEGGAVIGEQTPNKKGAPIFTKNSVTMIDLPYIENSTETTEVTTNMPSDIGEVSTDTETESTTKQTLPILETETETTTGSTLPISETESTTKQALPILETETETTTGSTLPISETETEATTKSTLPPSGIETSTELLSTTEATTETQSRTGSFVIGDSIMHMGDYYQMGTYYDEPILWRCVDIDKNGPLLLSDKILCYKAFDANSIDGQNTNNSHSRGKDNGYCRRSGGSNYWGDSNIRDWLNSDASPGNVSWSCGNPPNREPNAYDQEAGFLNGFTEEEKSVIKTVMQKQILYGYEYDSELNENYYKYCTDIFNILQNYDTAYSELSEDRVFLLDVKQLYNIYINWDTYYLSYATPQAIKSSQHDIDKDMPQCYWLRTPEAYGISFPGAEVRYVDYYSDNDSVLWQVANAALGIRPAFYLDNDKAVILGGHGTESDPYILSSLHTDTLLEYEVTGGNIYMDASNGTIVNCDDTVTEITIPTQISGIEVRAIAENAFARCTALKKVICEKDGFADNAALYPDGTEIVYAETLIYGDVDVDQKITASDAAYLLQAVLTDSFEMPIQRKTADWLKYADVDCDMIITASDAAIVLQKTLDSTFMLHTKQ